VARMIFYESMRAERQARAGKYLALVSAQTTDPAAPLLDQLDQALARLSDDDRNLVLRYYGEGRKDEIRRELAREYGVTNSNLRVRAHRVRQRLEAGFSNA
jgi:DNA-directed RNA polymerase specialized sigma24 family protein